MYVFLPKLKAFTYTYSVILFLSGMKYIISPYKINMKMFVCLLMVTKHKMISSMKQSLILTLRHPAGFRINIVTIQNRYLYRRSG